ncbi:hypothetical protein COW94_04555 [Candidatus Peregrinibacteria bacterium CG22_combo_CG10-13_8_21_14_all_44_10]|nr:MAG: hypothetical protein AUK45_03760 [Candidatus Peregrinibacteria bacterium CG2_30_44_17]PIP65919.1 MAG: hypothetical protein COW94_04555 [Candidatus Peregrinibacteria bacterium CG22_combo_CG10-13_8_21_14_all_44_10]PIX79769.1 MAG: hypothetical protein COZ35_02780 [Candidatus Peregrinibacteria bacterium CG_4_10_14_3_um_filter_44_21]PJB88355.1 MAG: hypothetical protein CO082_04840 [Candidatus Peregrinibacteria bacterium CG_4_9_14_0_8_um_filter_44_15]
MKKAITIIEIMLVITLMSLMLGLSILYSQTTIVRSDLNGQRNNFISALRLAQSDAMAGKDAGSHGVHIESNSYTTFSGDSYIVDGTGNVVNELPSTLQFTNITLNGGGTDIIFTSPEGATDQYGSVDLYSQQISTTSTITINQLGVITY